MSENLDSELSSPEELAEADQILVFANELISLVDFKSRKNSSPTLGIAVDSEGRGLKLEELGVEEESYNEQVIKNRKLKLSVEWPLVKVDPETRANRERRLLELSFIYMQPSLLVSDPELLKIEDSIQIVSPIGSILPPPYDPEVVEPVNLSPTLEQLGVMTDAVDTLARSRQV